MSRIISGLAGSIKLKAAAKATRPTSDRVKESLFAKLENLDALEGAKVLDLYAGSGALGLEAASRGAIQVDFVEIDRQALKVLRENIFEVQKALEKKALLTAVAANALSFCKRAAQKYDLILLDPPYSLNGTDIETTLATAGSLLLSNGFLVLERPKKAPSLQPDNLHQILDYTVGDTRLVVFSIGARAFGEN